jgi:hypothetical protein
MRGRPRGGGIVAAPDRRGRVVAVALAVAILALVGILGLRHRALDQPHEPYLGAYLGSGAEGVDRVADFERWLGATMTVGRTYLGGRSWDDIDGAAWAIDPWEHLVRVGAQDVILDLGWEMNGTSYSSRCQPDPARWVAHYRSIVSALRAVPRQDFRFQFTPDRGSNVLYQSISDYCPHGVWRCAANPNASDEYRSLFSRH